MNLSLKETSWMIVTNIVLAAGATLVLLMALEWLMPGSVLPFVDVVDFLAPVSVVLLIVASFGKSKNGFFQWMQTLSVVLTAVVLVGILAARLNVITLRTVIPIIALIAIASVWTMTTNDD
ncbi:MAG: hypothetical protein PHS79_02940 [Patescibacteria group bacterium]|nr:hypothetical protein [Patescibacteria group bacterium]